VVVYDEVTLDGINDIHPLFPTPIARLSINCTSDPLLHPDPRFAGNTMDPQAASKVPGETSSPFSSLGVGEIRSHNQHYHYHPTQNLIRWCGGGIVHLGCVEQRAHFPSNHPSPARPLCPCLTPLRGQNRLETRLEPMYTNPETL